MRMTAVTFGQDVAGDDARVAGADHPRGLDVLVLFGGNRRPAYDARRSHREQEADADDDIDGLRDVLERGDNKDDEDEAREGDADIDDALDEHVEPTAEVSGGGAKDGSDDGTNGDHAETDEDGRAGAVDDAGVQVTAELVGAEPVGGGGAP